MKKKTISLLNKVKKYNGEFVSLWHRSNMRREEWSKGFSTIYYEVSS